MDAHISLKRWSLAPVVVSIMGFTACDATTRIDGRVVLPEVPDASGVVVNAYMGKRPSDDFSHGSSTTTDAAGNYSIAFRGVGGRFFVTAYAMSTIESVMATWIDLDEGATGTVPDLVFTPVGSVSGRVTLEGAAAGYAGTTVAVEGSDMMALTDDSGEFSLSQVRLGSHRLEAEHDAYESASVEIGPVEYDEDTPVGDIVLQSLFEPSGT